MSRLERRFVVGGGSICGEGEDRQIPVISLSRSDATDCRECNAPWACQAVDLTSRMVLLEKTAAPPSAPRLVRFQKKRTHLCRWVPYPFREPAISLARPGRRRCT